MFRPIVRPLRVDRFSKTVSEPQLASVPPMAQGTSDRRGGSTAAGGEPHPDVMTTAVAARMRQAVAMAVSFHAVPVISDRISNMSISARLISVVGIAIAGVSVVDVRTEGQSPAPAAPNVAPRPYFTEPAISPDRNEIAFASGGDIWTAPIAGGDARLLVSHV